MEEVLADLFVGELGALRLGDGVPQDLRLVALGARLNHFGAVHLVVKAAFTFEVTMHLLVNHVLRNRDVGLSKQRLNQRLAGLLGLTNHATLGDLLLERSLELPQGVELARHLGEVVVGLGQLALLDGANRDRNLGDLTGVFAAEQRGGKRGGLPRGERVERFVDAFEQFARAELVADACGLVDLGAVNFGGQIERDEVSGLGRAVHRDECAEAGAERIELVLHVVGADCDLVNLELETLVVGQLDLGTHVHFDFNLEVAREVGFGRPLDNVSGGAAERGQLGFGQGDAVEAVEALVDGVLEHGAAANPLVDDGGRHLALAEAGNVDRLGNVLVRVVNRGLELLRGDQNGELDAGGAQLLNRRGGHDSPSPLRRHSHSKGPGRGDRIRTCDFPLPKRALYQAELRPETGDRLDSPRERRPTTSLPGRAGPECSVQYRWSTGLGDVAQW